MTEARASIQVEDDDVDLSVVVRKFVRFFSVHGKLLLTATLLGLGCGFFFLLTGHKHFTGELVIGSTVLNTQEMQELMEGWQPLLSRPAVLAETMGCSPEIVKHIGGLSAEPLPEDEEHTYYMLLTVTLRDTGNLREVQDAIIRGIRNNEYVSKRAGIRMAGLDEQIKKASAEITRLDSTREFIESLSSASRKDDKVIIDLSNISKQKVAIQAKLSGYREKRAFGDGAMLVIGFAAIKGPKPGLLTMLSLGVAAGFLIGYFLVILLSVIRLAKHK
jgi:hypothetical protein